MISPNFYRYLFCVFQWILVAAVAAAIRWDGVISAKMLNIPIPYSIFAKLKNK